MCVCYLCDHHLCLPFSLPLSLPRSFPPVSPSPLFSLCPTRPPFLLPFPPLRSSKSAGAHTSLGMANELAKDIRLSISISTRPSTADFPDLEAERLVKRRYKHKVDAKCIHCESRRQVPRQGTCPIATPSSHTSSKIRLARVSCLCTDETPVRRSPACAQAVTGCPGAAC